MTGKGLDTLIEEGMNLPEGRNATATHDEFIEWAGDVRKWLKRNYPDNPELLAEWASIESSELVSGGYYAHDPDDWQQFGNMIRKRMKWLGTISEKTRKPQQVASEYVSQVRIGQLMQLPQKPYDMTRLIRLCEELNICHANECHMAVAVLVRAVLDHVPPIFNFHIFKEFANSYQSIPAFKSQMLRLENESRKIADNYLHSTIRSSEVLPLAVQVDFRNILDSLLGEIVRVLKIPATTKV